MHQSGRRTLSYPPGVFQPEGWLRFVQLTAFSRKWDRLGLKDDDLRCLEGLLMAMPESGPVVRGTNGVRKLRFSGFHPHKGKSGAYRVYYKYFDAYGTLLLITIFAKNELSELSTAGKRLVAEIVRETEELLEQGAI